MEEKALALRYAGAFSEKEAKEKNMRLVEQKEGDIHLFWLVDETDGVIADVKYQAFGPIALIAALEAISFLTIRKTYLQAARITADLLDKELRDKKEEEAFSFETHHFLNSILLTIDQMVECCQDLQIEESFSDTPIGFDLEEVEIEGFFTFNKNKQLLIINEVIDKEIRPYIELDAGGVEVLDFKDNKEVLIAYSGSCTSCYAATGSTLNAIQKILQARISKEIIVTPKL